MISLWAAAVPLRVLSRSFYPTFFGRRRSLLNPHPHSQCGSPFPDGNTPPFHFFCFFSIPYDSCHARPTPPPPSNVSGNYNVSSPANSPFFAYPPVLHAFFFPYTKDQPPLSPPKPLRRITQKACHFHNRSSREAADISRDVFAMIFPSNFPRSCFTLTGDGLDVAFRFPPPPIAPRKEVSEDSPPTFVHLMQTAGYEKSCSPSPYKCYFSHY